MLTRDEFRTRREELDLSQRQLATYWGYSKDQVGRMERGEVAIRRLHVDGLRHLEEHPGKVEAAKAARENT